MGLNKVHSSVKYRNGERMNQRVNRVGESNCQNDRYPVVAQIMYMYSYCEPHLYVPYLSRCPEATRRSSGLYKYGPLNYRDRTVHNSRPDHHLYLCNDLMYSDHLLLSLLA